MPPSATRAAPRTATAATTAPDTAAPVTAAPGTAAPRLAAAPVAPAPAPAGSATAAWAIIADVDHLSGRRIPATPNNVRLLQRWMANEGGLWADNPLNTSLHASAYAHQFTASGQDTGIPIFPSLSVGEAATAATLVSNPAYAHILGTLSSGSASCLAFARVVIRSPWAASHYGHNPSGFCSGHIVPARRGRGPRWSTPVGPTASRAASR